ncbi:MAG: SMC-Scp complex subunit ScpB [Gemmataceae bacterium]
MVPTRHLPLSRRVDCLPVDRRLPAIYRLLPQEGRATTAPLVRDGRLARLEAALFCADEPLAARKLTSLADLADAAEARQLIDRLGKLYSDEGAAFQIEEIAGGYQLLTRPAFHPWLVRLRQSVGEAKLSGALLETLAIVAYRQPIMRADLEGIRGVHCGESLRQLMERGYVRIAGRDDSLGRPVLYGTTKKFLQAFGLRDLRDLPPVGERGS